MSGAREEILARVRMAVRDVPAAERPGDVPVPRAYRRSDDSASDERLDRFESRLRDYGAEMRRATAAEARRAVSDGCAAMGLETVVVPVGFPDDWLPSGVAVAEDRGFTAEELDRVGGALTGCAVAIADTGTLVLDGRGVSGRRAITLVPDHHICVVNQEQLAGSVPAALARVAPAVREHRSPITLISGPSASSDIELSRVEGVHGPRHLLVIVVAESPLS